MFGIPPVSIKFNSSREQVNKQVQKLKENFHKAVVSRFTFIGEGTVKRARESGSYTDRTGALRSSIGFLVLYNGVIQSESFEQAGTGPEAAKGVKAAKDLASEIAKKYPTGYVLIIVAGMEYAAAVESKNYEVLSGASDNLESEIKKAIADITKQL